MDKKIKLLILSIIVVVIILSTTTYALVYHQDKLENEEKYTTGVLDIALDNTESGLGETLTLTNSIPITDAQGKASIPYKFKVTNNGNVAYTFNLKILSTTTDNSLDNRYVKIMIDNNNPTTLSSLTDLIIASNLTLNPGESKIISVRVWLDENTPNTQIGKSFSAKIIGDGKAT